MKKLLLFIITGVLMSSCMRVFVENDYRYSTQFKKYKTYAFVDCERDTNILCEDVQQAIQYQMRARGYEFNAQKPNIFVNFSIYYDRLKYKGYEQPALVSWVSTEDDSYLYKPVKYELGKGTLMISMIEAETSEVVWRGYATGIFNKASSKKNYFKSIVRNIFDQYPLFATNEKSISFRENSRY
ncbi:lipoprotein [Emticicia oligotrophica DSM 17448]|uniref:Lipoprotein n=1 Tax=Emticicia oligotrophica (strain DSM 17448 / CIP 109782 / MTCC 6937 / GPTSA100-15) TaxID=929562 RepID=A0ABM5N2P3_EMTOG|nr:DUF4136 domain-containing protein [Emticicia oligotrophica]AFK03705.1 lipoprotein [Emticicia oligotrophica DSM 17448]